ADRCAGFGSFGLRRQVRDRCEREGVGSRSVDSFEIGDEERFGAADAREGHKAKAPPEQRVCSLAAPVNGKHNSPPRRTPYRGNFGRTSITRPACSDKSASLEGLFHGALRRLGTRHLDASTSEILSDLRTELRTPPVRLARSAAQSPAVSQ